MSATRNIFGKPLRTVIMFIMLLVATGLILMSPLYGFFGNTFVTSIPTSPSMAFGTAPALKTEVPVQEVSSLLTSTFTSAPTVIETFTFPPVNTPLPYRHDFEILKRPPGSPTGYLVHIVHPGETLEMIAEDYNTTVQAIIAVNYKLKPPVWAQYPIVIPVNTKDAAGLPAFEIYVVETYEHISAKSLAELLRVDVDALGHYNLCNQNCEFHKGDVLLIPYVE